MDLKKLNEKLDQIKLEKETKEALLDVIDTKISDDMDRVIAEMKSLKNELKNENTFIKWLIGGIFAAITILLAIVAFKK